MGEIIISVKNKKKLELLKRFLESVEYVDSVSVLMSSYEKLITALKVVCEVTDGINTKPGDVLNKMEIEPILPEHRNHVRFVINFAVLIFNGEGNKIPTDPKLLFKHLTKDGKKLLKYIERNYIAFTTLGKVLDKTDLKPTGSRLPSVNVADINECIEKKLKQKEQKEQKEFKGGHALINQEELEELFKEKKEMKDME